MRTLTPEQHIWACALEVERQYGGSALAHCAERIADLTHEGDQEGAATWRMIAHRLNDLKQCMSPSN